MSFFTNTWRAITHTKALDDSSGELETAFFETAHRIVYVAGVSTYDHGFFYKLYSITVNTMLALFIMTELWYVVSVDTSLDKLIEQMNLLTIELTCIFKYLHMQMHRVDFKKLASSMQLSNLDISTTGRKALLKFWITKGETYLKLLLGLGIVTLAFWNLYPLVNGEEYNFFVALWLPEGYNTPRNCPIGYIISVIILNSSALFVMSNHVMLQAHLIHLICQYTVLADCFENILVDCGKEFNELNRDELVRSSGFTHAYISRLGLLVQQHKKILMHTMDLRRIISLPMTGQVGASGLQICFTAYQVAASMENNFTKLFTNVLYLGYNLFELFVICRWCDEIKIQSENIGDALYCSGWECGLVTTKGIRAGIITALTRASKPVVLTAGGIYDLSLNSYAESFQDSGGPLKDLSIRVSAVKTLAEDLRKQPEFTLEGFKQTGYYQVANVGKYISTNLRNYLFHGNVNPKDEGVLLTFHYSDKPLARKGSIIDQEDGTMSYYIHKTDDLTPDERKHIYRYLDTVKGHRNNRDISN